MENLSDLDDCINTLEQLQLTLDFETSTVKRNPKIFSVSDSFDHSLQTISNNRIDLLLSNQNMSDETNCDSHLPDITKSSPAFKNEPNLKNGEKNKFQSNSDNSDFKSLLIRRAKLTSNMSNDNELFSVPECDVTDFPPPPPPINIDSDNYLKSYVTYRAPKQQSPVNSNPSTTGSTPTNPSSRKHSTNSLKLSTKPLLDPLFFQQNNSNNNNNINNAASSANSSQSNLSSPMEKESSKEMKTFPSIDAISERPNSMKQTVVRFFSSDKTTKALIINDKMTVESVIKVLMEKNFWIPSLKSAIVEKVPSLKMERFFEEHEILLDCVNSWPSTCSNMIFFEQREDIYGLFENTKQYLGDNYPLGAMNVDAIKNLFYTLSAMQHDYQDYIYIKKPAENSWKRKFCLLNHNGITTIQKKKSKGLKSHCNVMELKDKYCLYTTTGGWTKEWNAPTPFGFAFKPYSVVDPKSTEVIMFCASDEVSMKRWCSNLRLCKYKNQILNNYQQMQDRSIYCSNLYMSDHQINRTLSLSPAVYSQHSSINTYISRCSLPTASLGESKTNLNKF